MGRGCMFLLGFVLQISNFYFPGESWTSKSCRKSSALGGDFVSCPSKRGKQVLLLPLPSLPFSAIKSLKGIANDLFSDLRNTIPLPKSRLMRRRRQGIDWQQVKNEQAEIHEDDSPQQPIRMRRSNPPSTVPCPDSQRIGDPSEHNIYKGACGNAPECGSGSCWWVYVRHPAQWPEHYLVGCSPHLATSERMTELVQSDNKKKCQILGRVPS